MSGISSSRLRRCAIDLAARVPRAKTRSPTMAKNYSSQLAALSPVDDHIHSSAEGPAVIHAVCRAGPARPRAGRAKTIWLFREQLARAGATELLFARFDALLRAKGWLAMGGQIVDATVIAARRPRLTQAEKDTIKGGGVPAEWKPARRAQIDRDGRWTIKRGKKRAPAPGAGHQRQIEIAVPVFGYKNHVGIDREHGFVRRCLCLRFDLDTGVLSAGSITHDEIVWPLSSVPTSIALKELVILSPSPPSFMHSTVATMRPSLSRFTAI